jgi:PIN domain nuclease of toxin-antitoxin system
MRLRRSQSCAFRRLGCAGGNERMISMLPLDIEVILASDALPASFHGDPVDRLIVATVRAYGLALATHDATIRRSRAVKIWKQ